MARTQAVIIYSESQALRRRLILPDDDSQIPVHTSKLQPGEKALVITLSDYQTRGPDACLALYTGRKPSTDRCALINHAGMVVGVIHADPGIDRHPAGRLHRDPDFKAAPGAQALDLGLLP